jgi:serine/threonine-protein kinase
MLTRRKPFDVDTAFALMRAHVELVPQPPSAVRRDLPDGFDAVILKALAKNPDERFQSADDFRRALEGLALSGDPLPRRAAGVRLEPKPAGRPALPAMESRPGSPRFSRAAMILLVPAVLAAGFSAIRFVQVTSRVRPLEHQVQKIVSPNYPPAPVEPAIRAPDASAPAEAAHGDGEPVRAAWFGPRSPARLAKRSAPQVQAAETRPTGGTPDAASASAPEQTSQTPEAIAASQTSSAEPTHAGLETEAAAGVSNPPAAGEAPSASKPRKSGNRFFKALGRILPFRKAAKEDPDDPPPAQTGKN